MQSENFSKIDENYKDYLQKLPKFFQKNQGRNFANFLIKRNDDFIYDYFNALTAEFFENFAPPSDAFSVSVLAVGKYAQGLISVNSALEILIVYKNLKGYAVKNFVKSYAEILASSRLNVAVKAVEISEFYEHYKNDVRAKSEVSQVRYICGSKSLYRLAKGEILRLKEHEKKEFLRFHLKALAPFDDIKFLKQEPDLETGFGGCDEIWHLNCVINSVNPEISVRAHALKFMDEKEIGVFNLNVDFLTSLKSALNLTQNSSKFSASSVDAVTALMQTKSKKTQGSDEVISQKMLSGMNNIAIYARFLSASLTRGIFSANLTFAQRRAARMKNGFYEIDGVIYSPAHKKPVAIDVLTDELLSVKDADLKFDISAVFYVKRAVTDKDALERATLKFKNLFLRRHAYPILKALLDAQMIAVFIKPLEHVSQLAQYDGYHDFTVDEHSVLSVKYLENIKDKFIKNLYLNLCPEGRATLKAAALMHDVGKGLAGDHSVVGANMFRAYAAKLGFEAKFIGIGVLLVRHHTLMSNVANREDIYSQRAIFSFISKLGEKGVLNMLYVLTYCVVNATSEKLYNAYAAKLLRELYEISLKSFDDENLLDEATRRVKKERSVRKNAEFNRLSPPLQEKIFKIVSNLLFAKYSAAQIIALARLADEASGIKLSAQNQQNLSLRIISDERLNLAALLVRFANFDLAYMEIFELFDQKIFARLDFNKNIKTSELKILEQTAVVALRSDEKASAAKPNINKDEINFDPSHSNDYAKLTINARDQRGLMAYVMGVLDEMDFKVASARIQTIKNRTRNLFLIEKNERLCRNGEKILNLLISE